MLSFLTFVLLVRRAVIVLDKAVDVVDPQSGMIGKPDPSDIID
jgi:hypothetical protein